MRFVKLFATLTSLMMSASLNAQEMAASTYTDGEVFNFSAVNAGKKLIEGTVTVFKDSMIVTPKSGHCTIAPYGDDLATVARFKCSGVMNVEDLVLTFERTAPDHATFSGSIQKIVARREKACVQVIGGPPGTVTGPPRCTITELPPGSASGPIVAVSGKMKVTPRK